MSDLMSVRLHLGVFVCWVCWLTARIVSWLRWDQPGSGRGAVIAGSDASGFGTVGRRGFVILG